MTTDKGQDALEVLRFVANELEAVSEARVVVPWAGGKGQDVYTVKGVHGQAKRLRAAIAALEKERAGFEALMPHVNTIKELVTLRSEVQAVEEDLKRPQFFCNKCAFVGYQSEHPNCGYLAYEIKSPWRDELAERLRKARAG